MDNHSQSSDVFSGSGGDHEHSIYAANSIYQMDQDSYSSLVSSTKLWLSQRPETEIHNSNFPGKFTSILEDCDTCIYQSCYLIDSMMSEQDLNLGKLYEFMDDAVNLLQLLSGYVTNVIQTVSMACCSFGNFPTTTGHIIVTVFTHCKNSETLYGSHLKNVETQLKDLFRSCHQLQITYLKVLDKHFTFDLQRYEEMDILLEALNMNLQIGEVVQTLDVKTMAEQWKGYMLLCEKYAASLAQSDVFYNTTKLLTIITEKNIKTALETNQDEKMTVRSLKVASFTIKILIKVCNIFKQATIKDYEHILELLLTVYLNSSPYLQMFGKKPPQLIQMMKANILPPCEVLLKELLADELFLQTVIKFDIEARKHDDAILGYILLIMSIIKLTFGHDDHRVSNKDLIESVYKFLPYGHIWFNMGLKFDIPSTKVKSKTYGLYEHLLSHMYALATKLKADERTTLQERMIEALLGTDTYSALFSANLWRLVARLFPPDQLSIHVKILAHISSFRRDEVLYERWKTSPQRLHIMKSMGKLFELLTEAHKLSFYQRFNSLNVLEGFYDVWSAVKLCNLPEALSSRVDDTVSRLMNDMQHVFENIPDERQIYSLSKLMHMVSTADLKGSIKEELIGYITKAWIKSCPNKNNVILQCIGRNLDDETAVIVNYIRSLALLTQSVEVTCFEDVEQVKILHTVSSIIQHGSTEFKLAVMDLLLELARHQIVGESADISNAIHTLTFRTLLQEKDALVREKFYNLLRKYKQDKCVIQIVSNAIENDRSLQTIWDSIRHLEIDSIEWKTQVMKTLDVKFVHKCLENTNAEVIEHSGSDSVKLIDKTNSNNFDFADIDSLFEADSDNEPACKKVKLNPNEVSEIVARLEKEIEQLCQVKENVFTQEHKCRIREVCSKLQRVL